MPSDPKQPQRKSIRLNGYDYSGPGAYFVTICVQGRRCCLGTVEADRVKLWPAGVIVEQIWRSLGKKYPHVDVDEFIVMPNHTHGIKTPPLLKLSRGSDPIQDLIDFIDDWGI